MEEATAFPHGSWRMVTTGHDASGAAAFRSDHPLAFHGRRGAAEVCTILSLDGPPRSIDDGENDGAPQAPRPGCSRVDALRVQPTAEWLVSRGTPTDTFEALIVVRGELEVTVGDDSAALSAGSTFISTGVPFTARTSETEETFLVSYLVSPEPSNPPGVASLDGPAGPAKRTRRVVAGIRSDRRPGIVQDGDPRTIFVVGDETSPDAALADIWEFGGPLASADQGGDAPEPFELEPRGRGAKLLDVEIKPTPPGSPIVEAGWHATSTIDVDVIISGAVKMHLPNTAPVLLQPGDILLQRGTNHVWEPVGPTPLRMMTVMIAV